MAGFKNAKYELRGQQYHYNFAKMKQQNVGTGKERQIRPPHGWKAPTKPIVPAGPTMTVRVPPKSAGTTIHVPHPKFAGQFIAVEVPKNAREGQAMMVPVPMKKQQLPEECFDEPPAASAPALPEHKPVVAEAVAMAPTPAKPARKGWSTGAKVAGVAAVGGLAVGGALLGTEIAEHGAEATFDTIGDGLSTGAEAAGDALGVAGEHIVEFAGDAGDWFVDAADTTGDFIMDLF
jgi:hypothetical protein